MSPLFEPFKDDWLTHTDIIDNLATEIKYTMHLSDNFFEELKFDTDSLRQYRIGAAKEAADKLGHKPVLCLSGGVDSQAMIQCWQEAGIDFDTAIMVFDEDLNSQDVDHARAFCEYKNITPIEINVNVIRYLVREHLEQAERYQCSSPHFSTHYRMFDILREMGYTGICCGGTAFARNELMWGPTLTAAQMNYLEYMRVNQFPIMGNFLGYLPELCWTIAILTPAHTASWVVSPKESLSDATKNRYVSKVTGYQNHGFDILPQETKITGFEKVKQYFADQTGDGWEFEKKFRYPLQKKFSSAVGSPLRVTPTQVEILDRLHRQCIISSD